MDVVLEREYLGLLDQEITSCTGESVQWCEFEFGGHRCLRSLKAELNTLYSSLIGIFMSGNTFGTLFTVSTAGESHSLDWLLLLTDAPQIPLSVDDLQIDLDRKPGQSKHDTASRS